MNIEKWENGRLRFYYRDNGRLTTLLITDATTIENGSIHPLYIKGTDAIVGSLPNSPTVKTELLEKYDNELTSMEEFVYDRIDTPTYENARFIIPKVAYDAMDVSRSFDDNVYLLKNARMLTGSNQFVNKKRVWDKLIRCMYEIDDLTATILHQSKFQYDVKISDYYVVRLLNENESEL